MATDFRPGYLSRLLRNGAKPFAGSRRGIPAFGARVISKRTGLPPASAPTSKLEPPVDETFGPVVEDELEGAIDEPAESGRATSRSGHASLDPHLAEPEQARMNPADNSHEAGQQVQFPSAPQPAEAPAQNKSSSQAEPLPEARSSLATNPARLRFGAKTEASGNALQNEDPTGRAQSREDTTGTAGDLVRPGSVEGAAFTAPSESVARFDTGPEKYFDEEAPHLVGAKESPIEEDKYPGRAVSSARRTSVPSALDTEPRVDEIPPAGARTASLRLPLERISFDEDSFLSQRLEAASKNAGNPARDSAALHDAPAPEAAAQTPKSALPGQANALRKLAGKPFLSSPNEEAAIEISGAISERASSENPSPGKRPGETFEPELERQANETSAREEPEAFGTVAEQKRDSHSTLGTVTEQEKDGHSPTALFLSRQQERISARAAESPRSPLGAHLEGSGPVIQVARKAAIQPGHQEKPASLSQPEIPADSQLEAEQDYSVKQERGRTRYSSIEEGGMVGTGDQPAAKSEGQSEAAQTFVEPVSINRTTFKKAMVDRPPLHRKIDGPAHARIEAGQSYSGKQENNGTKYSSHEEAGLTVIVGHEGEPEAPGTSVEPAPIHKGVIADISPLESSIESRARAHLPSPAREGVVEKSQEVLPAQTAKPRLREAMAGREASHRGAGTAPRLTINRLDVQIINQPPTAPPKPSPRVRAPVAQRSDWRNLDRHYIGRFDLG
jgi:hypothetical protein